MLSVTIVPSVISEEINVSGCSGKTAKTPTVPFRVTVFPVRSAPSLHLKKAR
jgi:hypothetical protein